MFAISEPVLSYGYEMFIMGKGIILEVAKTLGTKWVNEPVSLHYLLNYQVVSIPEIKSLQLSHFPET